MNNAAYSKLMNEMLENVALNWFLSQHLIRTSIQTTVVVIVIVCLNSFFLFLNFAEMLKSSSQKRTPEEQLHSKSEPSYTPLHQAAIAGDDATVEVLLVSGVDRFAKDNKVQFIHYDWFFFACESLNDEQFVIKNDYIFHV